jgi:hypothetical protein
MKPPPITRDTLLYEQRWLYLDNPIEHASCYDRDEESFSTCSITIALNRAREEGYKMGLNEASRQSPFAPLIYAPLTYQGRQVDKVEFKFDNRGLEWACKVLCTSCAAGSPLLPVKTPTFVAGSFQHATGMCGGSMLRFAASREKK